MSYIACDNQKLIYQEMLAHPALFSHQNPQKIALIGDFDNSILLEVLKHREITEIIQITEDKTNNNNDPRVHTFVGKIAEISDFHEKETFDVIIATTNFSVSDLSCKFNMLSKDGILVQLGNSPFDLDSLISIQQALTATKFKDIEILTFPQPDFPSGLRTLFLAKKSGIFRKIREKDIFNKSFITRYYNFDTHKAAIAKPEFMREKLYGVLS